MAEESLRGTAHAPGTAVKMITTPKDAPTIYADGINGLIVQPSTTRLTFYEQMLDTETNVLVGRHVVSIALPNDQIAAVAAVFNHILAEGIPTVQAMKSE